MIDFEMEKQKGLLYAKMPEHKYLVEKTKNFINWSLRQVSNPYVACSFGKDSAVMTDIILSIAPNTRIVFAISEETYLIDNYDEVIKDWDARHPSMNLTILYCEREEDGRTHTADKMTSNTEHDSFFVGLRKDESRDRRISLLHNGKFYKNKNGKIRICPMSDWKTKDIMAYIYSNNIPLLDTYKIFGGQERTTSVVPTKFREEMLSRLKHKDPSAYNRTMQIINKNKNV